MEWMFVCQETSAASAPFEFPSNPFPLQLLILSVCPPTNPGYTQRILATRLFNAELKKRLPREKFVDVSGHVTSSEGVVKQIYACDGTHLNRKAAELIEDGISACLA
jgi:hypothetical protein